MTYLLAAAFPFLNVILLVIVAGLIYWLVTSYLPIPEPFMTFIRVLLIVGTVVYIIYTAMGVAG